MKKMLVFAMALGLVLGMVSMSSAAVTVGGDVRLETTWAHYNDEASAVMNGVGQESYWELRNYNGSSTRMKIRYLSDDKKFGAYMEIGVYTEEWANNVTTRRTEFWYNWGGGRLLFGQTYDVMEHYWPSQNLDGALSMIGYGKAYFGRQEMVRVDIGDKYKFKGALVNPIKDTGPWTGGGFSYHMLPAVSLAAELNFGNVRVGPWFRWEYLLYQDDAADESDVMHTLDYGLYIDGNFGLVGFTAAISYGVNSAQSAAHGGGMATIDAADQDVEDMCYQLNYWGELRISTLAIGYGRTRATRDDWDEDPWTQGAYISYAIPFGQITFSPEIAWFDDGDDENGDDNGERILIGLFTKLAF